MPMDAAKIYGRGFAFPPRLDENGHWAFSEGEQNVAESIRVILSTEPGERRMLRDFGGGLKKFLFQPNTVATRRLVQEEIVRSLGRWEPRIRLTDVTVEAVPGEPGEALATLRYQLVATGTGGSLELIVRLNG